MRHAFLLMLLVGCTDTRDAITGTQSLQVTLVSPASPGDVKNRLPDTQRMVQVSLQAKDAEGNDDASFTASIRVYAQFLGTLTPELSATPLATVPMVNGKGAITVDLKSTAVFGPTTLWFDNGTDFGPDYKHGAVTGTSPVLWYRDPFVADLQAPGCENLNTTMQPNCMSLQDPLGSGPLEDKQIRVGASRHNAGGGTQGVLVVTSVYSQGYTVADVKCATGLPNPTPPCTLQPHTNGIVGYDHALVFTFSAARDQFFRPLVQGEVIESFNGGLSEFNGLTEVGFPRTLVPVDDKGDPITIVNEALMPAPATFQMKWFTGLMNMADVNEGTINFERNESGAVKFTNVTVCALDDGPDGVYSKYKQWSVDPDPAGLCKMGSSADRAKLISLITAGTDFVTDPHTLVGKKIDVVGILRPVNLPGFNVWIINPRGKEDIVIH